MMFVMAPAPWVNMLKRESPVDCSRRSKVISRKSPKEKMVTTRRYWVPYSAIWASLVRKPKKISVPNSPKRAKAAKVITASRMPVFAARSA